MDLFQECSEPMSPVRRTFCLLTLFDLGLSFLLWILYTQLKEPGRCNDFDTLKARNLVGMVHNSVAGAFSGPVLDWRYAMVSTTKTKQYERRDLGRVVLLITGMTPMDAFKNEVAHYTITHSLFDLVLLAAVRFVLLILAYGLFRLHNPWVVAVTTALSSGFLIAKVFFYSFGQEVKDSPILDYLLLVSSFILAWAETWFLDFKVLPRETKERLEALKRAASESTPLLYGGALRRDFRDTGGSNSAYYSPVGGGSPEETLPGEGRRIGSLDGASPLNAQQDRCFVDRYECVESHLYEVSGISVPYPCSINYTVVTNYQSDIFASLGTVPAVHSSAQSGPRVHASCASIRARSPGCFGRKSLFRDREYSGVQRQALIEKAHANLAIVKDFQARTEWRLEKQGKCGSSVYSLTDKKYGKIFKVDGVIQASTDELFNTIYHKAGDAAKWNPTLAFTERIDILDDHCDVTYVCVKDQAGGMVSSRDFVDVRCFEIQETPLGNRYVIAGTSCEHPRKPSMKEFVRGVNGPNAWIHEPIAPGANGRPQTRFTSFSNTNLKGWIPQSAVDNALSQVLLELIRHLQKKFNPDMPECTP